MNRILLLLVLLCTTFIFPQNYKQVKVSVNNPSVQLRELESLDVDVEHSVLEKDGSYTVFMTEQAYNTLLQRGYRMDVLIENVAEYHEKQPKLTETEKEAYRQQSINEFNVEGFGFGSMGGYYTLAEVVAQLDSMKANFPNLITVKQVLGNSIENRPIYMVKISDNPDIDEDEPEALYTALHHAREPQGMMTLIYYMYYLLENYHTNPSVKYLVDNRELYFVPVVNPDGYEYNRTQSPNGGGMWRKNRKNNGGSFGVDLNRNYGPMTYWNAPNGGSSTSASSDTYRGLEPFSEPETQALRNLVQSRKFRVTLNYHTYSNLLIYPYGALERETPDSMTFREFAQDMTQFNNYSAGTDQQTVGYSTRGNSDDFMYDGDLSTRGKIYAMTPEVGSSSDGFWPSQSRIYPLAQENVYPNLYYAWVAGDYVGLQNVSYDRQYFGQGENAQMFVQLKNKGLSAAFNLSVQLSSASALITAGSGQVQVDSVSARSTYQLTSPLTFSVSPDAAIGTEHKLIVKTSAMGVLMSTDTVRIVVGMPVYTFFDTTNNPETLWTVTANPANPKWEATALTYNSSPNSYADSKNGNYVANATVALTMTNQFNLSGNPNPKLTFWTRYGIEADWDAGFVKISTNNGSNWTALAGRYTRPGSGQGKQVPAGIPCYDGRKTGWVQEEINLSAYEGQQIKLRFELLTDGSVEDDGWYIDDIGIYTWGVVPVELTGFSAKSSVNGIVLSWATATETNNRGFEVQRSLNKAEWLAIGWINGAGTTAETRAYEYTDANPFTGAGYYRLVQHDYDGSIRIYGPVEAAHLGVYEYALMQNHPNPFNPETTIEYQIPEAGTVTLKIYDMLGKEIVTLVNSRQKTGRYSVPFNASQLASGVYLYELRVNNFSSVKKLNVLK